MEENEYRRLLRCRRHHERREGRRESIRRMRLAVATLCLAVAVLVGVPVPGASAVASMADGKDTGSTCSAVMAWPLPEPTVLRWFDGPARPWMPGHRGVDLAASEGEELAAPADGVIGFSGSVAGKSVVTINHGTFTSTFEPAASGRDVGSAVRRGEKFATVSGGSDHCGGSDAEDGLDGADAVCVHWGVRRADREYADPESLTAKRRIVLKPVR